MGRGLAPKPVIVGVSHDLRGDSGIVYHDLYFGKKIPIEMENVDKMAEENIPAPTRSDDQLVPVKARLPYGKSNLLLDLQKLKKNPIFRVSINILQNTNFFKAFTTSTNVPSIYIQQFWNTLTKEAKSGVYSFQLDEQWFPFNADLLREALEITPVDPAHPFVSPPTGEQNFCGKSLCRGFRLFSHRASLSIPSKKSTPHVIPYCRFTKMIIYYLGSKHNIYRRPESPVHVTGDDFLLGNLNFIPKGKKDEVFGKPILKELITEAIQTSPYFQQYLEMAARKPTAKRDEHKKTTSEADKPKKSTPVKQTKPTPAKQPKPVKEKTSKPTPSKKASKGKVRKVLKSKSPLQLVDEEEQVHLEPEPQVEEEEYDLQRAETTRQILVVEGKGKCIATDEQDALSLLDLDKPKKKSVDTNKTNSEGDTEILNVGEEQVEDVSNKVDLEEKTTEVNEGQVGSNPGKTPESRPPPEYVLMEEDQARPNPRQSHVALVGPDPEPIHDDFVATVYPKVHEILKHTTEEHVHLENPLSLSGTVSSMKNLEDNFTFGDQFINDKPTEEDPGKSNVETKVESMVTDQTIQAISSRVFMLENHDLYSKIDKQVNEVVKEAVHDALQALILERFRELSKVQMKEILHDRMFESGSYKSHSEHKTLYEALEASKDRDNKEEFRETTAKSRKRRRDDQDPHPPPPKDSDQSKKKKNPPAPPNKSKLLNLNNLLMTFQYQTLSVSQTRRIQADAIAKLYKDPEENKLLRKTRDMGSFIKWYCRQIGKLKLSKADLEGPTFKVVKAFHKNNISLQFQMEECHLLLTDQIDLVNPKGNRVVPDVSKPLPLGGPPGQLKAAYYQDFGLEELVPSLWIESERDYDISAAYGISHWWFKCKEFYITRHGAPSDRHAVRSHMKILSVVSLKTFSRYGYTYLKEIVLGRADYQDYKISEADFKNLHLNDFEDLYLLHIQGKLNHLSRSEKVALFNAVNLWIRNIVIRHRVEDLQLGGVESYQMKLNLTQPSWDAYDFLFKEDYTIVHKPRAVIYRDRNNQKKMMRETEVHKFSDDMLTRILEKLDHMVKDYMLFKFNPGMENRIWFEDDKRRSKEFIEVIERRLKIRRIFRSLESFVSERLRDVDYKLIQRTE
ncbi:hypothetical protein Tco_0776203 [Tanacetum coccineum]